MLLAPHIWDDETHRAAIHRAFDRWAIAYNAGAGYQAGRYFRELRHLCVAAEARRLALVGVSCDPACPPSARNHVLKGVG